MLPSTTGPSRADHHESEPGTCSPEPALSLSRRSRRALRDAHGEQDIGRVLPEGLCRIDHVLYSDPEIMNVIHFVASVMTTEDTMCTIDHVVGALSSRAVGAHA